MKIAYVSTLRSSSWGGSEELWFQSAREAIRLNYDLGIFVYDWPDEPEQIRFLENKGASIYKRSRNLSLTRRILQKLASRLTRGNKKFIPNPYKSLLLFKPDIVIVTDGSTYYAANSPELSSILLKYFKNRYIIISQANSDYHLPLDREYAFHFFENALRVFFVSEHNKHLANHQLAKNLTRAELIQNPVLLSSLEKMPLPEITDTVHCAVVGRFCISDKGQDILIAMMSDPYWKDVNIKLHLYGKGQDQEYLKNLIDFYNLGDKVVIEGFFEDKNQIWRTCHCLLMCSHIEGTPLTLLEAMIVGRICIVSKTGGCGEWIRDGEDGFLVEASTKELFGLKMKNALSMINEWENIASEAHKATLKRLDINPGKTMLDRVQNLISVQS